jgi:RIO-like serine/threonine protein kinase
MQKAYEILNKLIKEGIIPEPKDYKEFCRILEIIKGVA